VRTDGVELNYSLEGPEDAPVLITANSLGTTFGMWDEQAPALSARFRLLRYDHRGHGGSSVPPGPYEIGDLGRDVLALLDTLGIERFSFCGLSLGGMVGMWLASEVPRRVERLVLCCTSALLGPPETWERRAQTARKEGVDAIVDAVLERWFTPPFRASRPEILEWGAGMLRGTPAEGYAGCCEAIRDMDLTGRLGNIRAPTLVIAGADDPATPPADHAEPIRDAIPDARLVVVPRAAHLGNVEQPEAFTRAILDHLAPVAKDGPLGDPVRDAGMRVRREVLGDAHVDRAISGTTPFTADFQDLITRYAWGEVWTRPGLDRKTRSCITLTALVALGHHEELKMHVRAALRNGLSEDDINEVLLQSAIYCGVPAANAAFAAAKSVLADLDAGPQGSQGGGHE
jgi:3-oxoadipate enol-lactonase/4-carboxymuconolactone decarboxylase